MIPDRAARAGIITTSMDDFDLEEVAEAITHALMTYKPPRSNNRLARAEHIVHVLGENGWLLLREGE